MSARVLLDTNVLVYAEDASEPAKRQIARELLRQLAQTETGLLSTQVLGEFIAVCTRKWGRALALASAEERVDQYRRVFSILPVTAHTVSEAVRGMRVHGFAYYDAQIWAAARAASIDTVLSEDFSDGARYDGVDFTNPFAPDFRLDAVLGG
jgi:predicted nucleic acid-binding protein